ncbi:RNAse Z [Archaeoglobus sulfaticallidus PM70-1]|uniref:Ribonuclease Z n=1 Tax=Archaeoglobus sulfaticallidus PM70-1 TaxID=387631 RepID=N0BJN8_9EURY|nr:ribonuclease Z [Archaeoglobus sulfaticallidus]AGK60711.1 RNAse Z [Archaeoglobus sulfaticallidus PM70-1]
MFLKVVFLGTSGTIPSVDRNPSSILINYNGEKVLFDCGEGTQRQMMIAKTGFRRLNNIFITHLHTDHFAGIFGLIETLSLNDRKDKLTIHSPNAIFLRKLFEMFGYNNIEYEIEVKDVKDNSVFEFDGFRVVAFRTDHIVESYGYAFIENDRRGKFNRKKAEELGIPPGPLYSKLARGESVEVDGKLITPDMVLGKPRPGRKIIYSGDTRPCETTLEISRNADLLIHDASFTSDLMEWAIETKHSTAKECAEIASKANVKMLILTHISARYSKDQSPLLEEAREIFDDVVVAHDFMEVDVPFRD